MRIAINTRLLLKDKLEGIGWFTMETMKRITRNHPEHEFLFIFDRPYSDEFIFASNITPVVIGPPARHPVLFYVWFNYSITCVLRKYKADIFISPDGYLSLRTGIPQLAVIHDISFRHRPEDLPRMKRWYYNYFFPRFAKKATRIATVSTFSKNDIAHAYDIDKTKIDVVFNGIKEGLKPDEHTEPGYIRQKYTGGISYFLYVGALQPRKNIEGLLKAYDLFRKKSAVNVKLMIVGGVMHKTNDISRVFKHMQFHHDVVFTGRVSETELQQIYSAALALVYVPFFEGFGMPVIEAMSAGIPVICSNTTSLPEVGDDAVLYVAPGKVEEISDAMTRIATGSALRANLIQKGLERSKVFSWDKTAGLLWNSIEKVLNSFA